MNHILLKSSLSLFADALVVLHGCLHILTDGRRYAVAVRRQVWRMLEGPGEQLHDGASSLPSLEIT